MPNDPIGINIDNRRDVSSKKASGFIAEKPDFRDFNQVTFQAITDHVWGTEAQADANQATIYTDSSGDTFDKDDNPVVLATDDKILIAHTATLAADLLLSTSAERLRIEMLKGVTLDLGDAGGGVPYLFQLDINNAKFCDIYTTEDFQDLSTLTDEQQRVLKNRGEGNKINLNGRQIFSGNRPTEIFSPVEIKDPYVISQNGFSYEGFKVSGSNDDVCLFTDWWKAWKGLDIVGDGSILIPPTFNPHSGVLQRKIFSDDPAGRFMRLNTPIGGLTDVDPGVHSRTSPQTLATISSGNYTSSASAEINDILDADATKLKVGARVQATGLPSPTTNTTIIGIIVYNGADDTSIFLIDSETGNAVSVSATGNLTIDMSGNSGISHQLDAMMRITGDTEVRPFDGFSNSGVFTDSFQSGASNPAGGVGGAATDVTLRFDSADSTSPNAAKTNDDETRVIGFQRQSYLIL